jgi:hypothetical protein
MNKVREALKNLASGLDEMYNNAMERIADQEEDDKKIACSTLSWVANAKRLLTVEEIQAALAIEPGTRQLDKDNMLNIDTILSLCAGLVIVDEERFVVRLVHYTTQEYWDRVQAPKFPDAQTEITCCLLTFLAFDNIYDRSDWGEYHNGGSALLDYCQYTLAHAVGKPEEALTEQITNFLEKGLPWSTIKFWRRPGLSVAPWGFDAWPEQTTSLWIAAGANLSKTAEYIIEASMSDALSDSSKEAVIVASYYGHLRIIELLINKGADVNALGGKYVTALQAASVNGHTDIAELLINKGADVNVWGGQYGTALLAASVNGHKGIAELLINKGCWVDGMALHSRQHWSMATKTLLSCSSTRVLM